MKAYWATSSTFLVVSALLAHGDESTPPPPTMNEPPRRVGSVVVRSLTPCPTIRVVENGRPVNRCTAHASGHIETRPGASVSLLSDGNVRIIEPMCLKSCEHDPSAPEIPWFVCQLPYQTPPSITTAPYLYATGDVPNPNYIATSAPPTGLDVQARFWKTMPIQYSVNYSGVILAGSGWTPGSGWILGNLGGGAVAPFPYTEANFDSDISLILLSIASNRFINLSFQQGAATNTNYETASPSLGTFQWDVAAGGPTGDGINEFIFLRNTPTLGTGGAISMDVDPTSGGIVEADVIFSLVGAMSIWSGANNMGPKFCTGLVHEIGHFLGLDHTNLALGGSASSPIVTPWSTGGITAPPSLEVLFSASSQIPAMTSVITSTFSTPTPLPTTHFDYFSAFTNHATGFRTIGELGSAINHQNYDDFAGLLRLYPEPQCGPFATSKLPWINQMATIRGRVTTPAGTPYFGSNVLLSKRNTGATSLSAPGRPTTGTLSGIASLGSTSVVGALDTVTSAGGSGEFRLVGVPAITAAGSPPLEWDIVAEHLGCVGLPDPSTSAGTLGEWFFEPTINSGFNPLPSPTTVLAAQAALLSSSAASPPPPVGSGSLQVLPGTIIDISTPIQVATGTPNLIPELVSRPLVGIQPRSLVSGAVPTSTTITVTTSNATAPIVRATANGVLLSPILVSGPSAVGSQFVSTFTAALPTMAQPISVMATARHGAPPTFGSSVGGYNQVIY